MSLYIGLMSGTSMDGIDAALVDVSSNRLIHGLTQAYSEEVKKGLCDLIAGDNLSLASFCQLNTAIGHEFALAVKALLQATNTHPQAIKAIGSHGQTVCHDTQCERPYTLQLGCPHTISSLTGIDVVADFRTRDIVNGGQGAPFAPLYHQELFATRDEPLAIVNLGGIANVTLLVPGQKTCGWDLGPANCLMDAWIGQHKGKAYDKSGSWAAEGQIIECLFNDLMSDPFLKQPPPKSIGKEYYTLAWLAGFLKPHYTPVDIQATLLAFTAQAIADALLITCASSIKKLYLCGGGAHNLKLHHTIQDKLPHLTVNSTLEQGVDPDFLEAMMFAWLADQAINSVPLDLSSITGAKKTQILGAIYKVCS